MIGWAARTCAVPARARRAIDAAPAAARPDERYASRARRRLDEAVVFLDDVEIGQVSVIVMR